MQGVILLLFAKYFHLPFLRDVQTDCTRTGLGGYWVSARGPAGPSEESPGSPCTVQGSSPRSPAPPTTSAHSPDPAPWWSRQVCVGGPRAPPLLLEPAPLPASSSAGLAVPLPGASRPGAPRLRPGPHP